MNNQRRTCYLYVHAWTDVVWPSLYPVDNTTVKFWSSVYKSNCVESCFTEFQNYSFYNLKMISEYLTEQKRMFATGKYFHCILPHSYKF